MYHNIRKSNSNDKEAVVELVKCFHEESLSGFDLSLDNETVEELVDIISKDHLGLIVEVDGKVVGVIGCLFTGTFFNKNEKVCQELIWYIKKEYRNKALGLKLLKIVQDECKKRDIQFIIMGYMGNLNAKIMDRFYRMNNYTIFENQFIRRVS
ncbi:MAG TPA: GNAT family N-acetyltransferase [bacterium]|nr:GNAT family N-acetyltransferase [bacterium]